MDAVRNAGIPRVVFISILECDKAPAVPHFREKLVTERYLAETHQPYLALRAGAFLDRTGGIVARKVRRGVFPDILPGAAMSMVYTPDLARYAVQAALDLPLSALNQSVDIGCDVPATGPLVAAAFTRGLGRPVTARPVFPKLLFTVMPLLARIVPTLRDRIAVLAWLRQGGYVSRDTRKQKDLFGELPTIEETVSRFCRDAGLLEPTTSSSR